MPRKVWLRAAQIVAGVLTAATIVVAGLSVTFADLHRNEPSAGPGEWPAARALGRDDGRVVVAVVIGVTGTVVTDALAPYEVFAGSAKFAVYTVAARREPLSLTGGLSMLPEHTFATAPDPDIVVVPAVGAPAGEREAPTRDWIAAQAGRGKHILGVCSGAILLAEAGVLDGRRATSFWERLDALERDFPGVRWARGVRYVQDGTVTTTAGVTSGIVGALRLVEQFAGPGDAAVIDTALKYPGGIDIPSNRIALSDLPYALNAAFPWGRPTVGIGLVEGVGEIDVAAAFELYAGPSSAGRAVPLADRPIIVTRHGVVLLPRLVTDNVPRLDRFLLPGVRRPAAPPVRLHQWAADRGLTVELPHSAQASGESGFDPILRDLATQSDRATARTTAKFIEYPIPGTGLPADAPAWPWRPTILALITVVLSVALAAVVVPRVSGPGSPQRKPGRDVACSRHRR